MTDIIDQAEEYEAMHRAAALARHQARPRGTGAAVCIDCDTPIPAARRRALPHADRCIGCQTLHERRL